MRVLVAAFGNELRGDDGFGIAVLRRLESITPRGRHEEIRFLEVGIGGIWLAQELLSPYDRLIIIDAVRRGEPPGTLYVLKVEHVDEAREIDMHLAVPSRALAVAKALGALPPETYLVGCEPASMDDLRFDLSERVSASVDRAAHEVKALMEAEG